MKREAPRALHTRRWQPRLAIGWIANLASRSHEVSLPPKAGVHNEVALKALDQLRAACQHRPPCFISSCHVLQACTTRWHSRRWIKCWQMPPSAACASSSSSPATGAGPTAAQQ